MKICSKCGGDPKPITEFSKAARGRDGKCASCKSCVSIASAAWYAANREKKKASGAKLFASNRDERMASIARWQAANPEKVKAATAKWHSANPCKGKASDAKYRVAHPEKIAAKNAEWRAANPEAKRINSHNYRARKTENGGKLSRGLSERLFKLQRGKCACGCKQPLGDNYHLDHRMPLALGGANEDWNMQLLRQRCNNQKYSKHPIDFMQQRGFLL